MIILTLLNLPKSLLTRYNVKIPKLHSISSRKMSTSEAKRNFDKYLFWFANEHVDFRVGELKAILSLLDVDIPLPDSIIEPFLILELPSESIALDIAKRSVTLKCILELWAEATNVQTLHSILKSYPQHVIKSYFAPDKSFKIKVEMFCNSQTEQEKLEKIESFHYLPIEGRVKLKNPDMSLQYIEYFGLDPNTIPEEPFRVFFGRKLADGRRDIITQLSLKSRKFIGNTSMDAQLSLIMANQGRVMPGDLVFDPFVGSGSLLISAAYFGAYVFGCDIDFMMLHGKTRPTRKQVRHIPRQNESVCVNFEQYGLRSRYIDVLVADSSVPFWRSGLLLDAIITDPPYGIREATEKVGTTKPCARSSPEVPDGSFHYPSKVDYSLPDILTDLMDFSARHLRVGGRLVYWIPVFRSEYCEDDLPKHSCFSLISNSEQVLSAHTSRRLLTYEKSRQPETNAPKESVVSRESVSFRDKFFNHAEETRQMKRKKKMENYQNYQIKLTMKEKQDR
uniref:tRNA (guanine(10)-N(2))-methyltransferase TRMT11 n=1 Tax=Cacopsylla melanoneura TaxID=428564 RepID=A0A8D8Q1J1_9HEMI